jgi:hypothetical protein
MRYTHRSSERAEVGLGNGAISSRKEVDRVRPEEQECCHPARGEQQSRNLSFIRTRRSLACLQRIRGQKQEDYDASHS